MRRVARAEAGHAAIVGTFGLLAVSLAIATLHASGAVAQTVGPASGISATATASPGTASSGTASSGAPSSGAPSSGAPSSGAAAPAMPSVQGTLQPPARAARPAAATVGCLIVPMRAADVGTPLAGVVQRLAVDVGDAVRTGQVLATLRAEVEAAAERAARERLSLDGEVRIAETQLAVAEERLERARKLHGQGFISSQGVEQADSERRIAEQRLHQAHGQRTVLARDLDVVRAQVALRTVTAPFDGIVVERYRQVGERVEDRPLVRVVSLNPLRVDLVMPATRWGRYSTGESVRILPELPSAQPVSGTVTHVDRVIDAASNTFRVRLSLPNPDLRLPAGARCTLDGDRDPADSAAVSRPQAPAAATSTPAPAPTAAPAPASASASAAASTTAPDLRPPATGRTGPAALGAAPSGLPRL